MSSSGSTVTPAPSEKKSDRKTVEALLKEIDITSSELSETEAEKLKELDRILSESPELKNLTMDDIIGMLNLTDDDKNQLKSQVDEVMKSGNIDLKNEELAKQFPNLDPTMDGIMKSMEAEFDKTPGLRDEFTNWINSVQEKLGQNFENMEKMTEEEINSISLPPPRLREVMDKYIPDMNKMNTLNLDEGMNMNFGMGDQITDEDGKPIEVEEIHIGK